MKTIIIALSILFLSQICYSHSACVHDEMFKDFKSLGNSEESNGRFLSQEGMSGLKTEYTPFRVMFETTGIENSGISQEKYEFIKNVLIPISQSYFEKILFVRQHNDGKITIPRTKYSWSSQPFDKCYEADIPESMRGQSFEKDLIIFATAFEDPNSSTLAWATNCLRDTATNGRPIMGQVQWNAALLKTDKEHIGATVSTTLHEITHVLGFSRNLFGDFVNPETGEKIGEENIIVDGTFRGIENKIIVSPKVKEVARNHFACPTLRGVEVENDGGSGSKGSHWERTVLHNEFMTASDMKNAAFSKFTLALLEDSGWYQACYEQADLLQFGENSGCNFAENGCNVSPLPDEFCDSSKQGPYCTLDHTASGYCRADSFTQSDGCSYVNAYSNGACNTGSGYAPRGTTKGQNSKCFISSLLQDGYRQNGDDQALCYEFSCSGDGKTVSVKTSDGKSVTCGTADKGNRKEADNGYSGSIKCPDPEVICEDAYPLCPNWCSGKGKCIRGKCMCHPGYKGEDCNQEGLDTQGGACSAGVEPRDYCKDVVCQNGGTCDLGTCKDCNLGWIGKYCDQRDPCLENNCSNNGKCDSQSGQCKCNPGFLGDNCSQADLCFDVTCQNEGTCNQGVCTCQKGFTGKYCEIQCPVACEQCDENKICSRCSTGFKLENNECSGGKTICQDKTTTAGEWRFYQNQLNCEWFDEASCRSYGGQDYFSNTNGEPKLNGNAACCTCGGGDQIDDPCDPSPCNPEEYCKIDGSCAQCDTHGKWLGSFCQCDSWWDGKYCEIDLQKTECPRCGTQMCSLSVSQAPNGYRTSTVTCQ